MPDLHPASCRPQDTHACLPSFQHLATWIEQAGGKVAPLTLRRDPETGSGVQATADIALDQIVLSIPHRCLITTDLARSSPIGRCIAAAGVQPASNHTWLAAFLLQERQAIGSPWLPYLDLLPPTYAAYQHVPLLFPADDLAQLRGSFALDRIRERRQALEREYTLLVQGVPELRTLAYEDFVWARLSVTTRVFGLTIAGRQTQGLVPLADLLNHKLPRQTKWIYQDAMEGFVMTALQAFSPGDAVHDSYGRRCNGRFFANYGFALPDNEDNEARLVFATPDGPRAFSVPARYDAPSTREMFSFLRRTCLRDNPLSAHKRWSAGSEEKVLLALTAAAELALSGFATTVSQDGMLLADPATEGNLRSCVLMRRGEKRVLESFVQLARAAIPLLRLPVQQVLRLSDEGGAGDALLTEYRQRVLLPLLVGR